jgi:uncharacterized protein YacL
MRARRLARFLGLLFGLIAGLEYALVVLSSARPFATETAVEILLLCMLAGSIFGFFGLEYVTIRPFFWMEGRLRSTPLPDLISAIGGLTVGLVLAALAAYFLKDLPYGLNIIAPAAMALLFGYWGVTIGLGRRDEVIALVRGWPVEPVTRAVLDTSAVIDGRIADVARSGFIGGVLIAPHFMLTELQQVADSAESIRRQRGRRGLAILDELKHNRGLRVEVVDEDYPEIDQVDDKLIRLAKALKASIITTDYNLNRVAKIEGVRILNINDLANALKPAVVPGEEITVTPLREGKEPNQGVAYLSDGTMVVIEGARTRLGQTFTVTVTNVIQTDAGRMIFASTSASAGTVGSRHPVGRTAAAGEPS